MSMTENGIEVVRTIRYILFNWWRSASFRKPWTQEGKQVSSEFIRQKLSCAKRGICKQNQINLQDKCNYLRVEQYKLLYLLYCTQNIAHSYIPGINHSRALPNFSKSICAEYWVVFDRAMNFEQHINEIRKFLGSAFYHFKNIFKFVDMLSPTAMHQLILGVGVLLSFVSRNSRHTLLDLRMQFGCV